MTLNNIKELLNDINWLVGKYCPTNDCENCQLEILCIDEALPCMWNDLLNQIIKIKENEQKGEQHD